MEDNRNVVNNADEPDRDRKQSPEKVDWYMSMIQEIEDYAIIRLDADGNILNWNAGAQKIKGYKPDEIIGSHFRIFYAAEDVFANLPDALLQEARDNGKAIHEGWRVRKNRSKFWGSITITAIHDAGGEVVGFTKVTRDLTERKTTDDRLNAYMQELEIRNRDLEQFAFIAAHDLQQPLRKITMFADMLISNVELDAQHKEYATKIHSSADRMSSLISSVLKYNRLGRDDEAFTTCDLSVILREVIEDLEVRIKETHAIIHGDSLPKVKGSPVQLRQLFGNLIVNALKYCSQVPFIKVESKIVERYQVIHAPKHLSGTNFYEISVVDNGIGFDEKYLDKIFLMFQRLHSETEYEGTGLGLALCKRITENHKGFITATSAAGHGATFYVYLPRS